MPLPSKCCRVAVHALCLLIAHSVPLHAARPLITDDARIVDPKSCQLETWVRRNVDSREYWALPACNPTGNLELSFGGAMTNELGSTHTTDVQVQAKTVFKPLEANGWAIGLAVGNLRHPGQRRDFASDLYGYVPASYSFANDRVVVHTNVGWLRPEDRSAHRFAWGIGAEVKLNERVYLIPEVFNQNGGRAHFQAGVRYWVIPGRMQVDATYGDRLGGGQGVRWYTLGMRLLSPAFLP